ncbi:unnamed protein product [Caenorhabditis angaria]|uniref:Serpentine Receptor, class BC (Class B-like) n=1 Tax=Caenorhabditis angaria TaxID=860376 RepID=A0A9P1N6D5_9PELO|nr:unnamed protein product [Caenorhabditis angaria]
MVTVKPAGFYFTLFGIFGAILTGFLNWRLIYYILRNEKYREKKEYQLFTFRFAIDCALAIIISIYFTGMCIFFQNSTSIQYHPLFFVALLASNINATRGLLAFCIAIERVIAVYFPIAFHNHRKTFSSYYVIILTILFGLFEDVVLYKFCDYTYVEKEECSAFGCAVGSCFLKYWGVNKTIIAGSTFLLSILLLCKLLVFKISSEHKTADLTRANQLCLVDTVTVLVFDLSPYFFTLLYGDEVIHLDGYGPYNAVIKVIACFVDAVIASIVIGKLAKPRVQQNERTTSFRPKIKNDANKNT